MLAAMRVLGATRMEAFWKKRPDAKDALSALLARLSATEASTIKDLASSVAGTFAEGDILITLDHTRVKVRVAFDDGTKSALIRNVTSLD